MENNQGKEKKTTVRAVERSLDILSSFINERELSLTEISKRTKLNKSTVFRLLNTLEQKGFLIKDPDTEKYRLGFKIWELSTNLAGMDDPATLFLPEMNSLRDTLDETISLYVRDGSERIRIQSVESNQAIRRVAPVGVRMPLSVGASSKILIAFEPPSVREDILEQLEKKYQINIDEFRKITDEVHRKGYATSFEEREIGAVAISCPVFSRSGQLLVALSVSGPVNRLTPQKLEEIVPLAIESAKKMGKLLK